MELVVRGQQAVLIRRQPQPVPPAGLRQLLLVPLLCHRGQHLQKLCLSSGSLKQTCLPADSPMERLRAIRQESMPQPVPPAGLWQLLLVPLLRHCTFNKHVCFQTDETPIHLRLLGQSRSQQARRQAVSSAACWAPAASACSSDPPWRPRL